MACKVWVSEFTKYFINPMPEKLLIEKKKVILVGDCNTNILNCNTETSNHPSALLLAPQLLSSSSLKD